MDQELEVTAKSEADAVTKALEELGLDADRVETEVEILGRNSKGILGLVGSKERRFLVKVKMRVAEAEQLDDISEEQSEGVATTAKRLLQRMLDLLKVSVQITTVQEEAEALKIEMDGEDSGILIGRRGQTLDALQYLLNIMVNRSAATPKRIVLDIEEYRARRTSELEELAKRTALQVVERGESIALRPMSAYERRIIHVALQDNEKVDTVSEGEEADRRVLVVPKE